MVSSFSKIHSSFEIVSLNPVRRAGDGNFMETLRTMFDDAQSKMQPVDGMQGVFTPNPEPPVDPTSLHITEASPLD